MEYTAIGQWSPSNPYPPVSSATWPALKNWNVNIIRIPLNEDSYLGLQCVTDNTNPMTILNADPGNNYVSTLQSVVDTATANGLYVILDLHWTAPDISTNAVNGVSAQCAQNQQSVPDTAHSITFWTAVANRFKGYPNVMFELFNEPYLNMWGGFSGPPDIGEIGSWEGLRDGGTNTRYVITNGPTYNGTWQTAGMQAMLSAVRATGATNVILESGLSYSALLDYWPQYHAIDPLNQLAAVWHAYHAYGYSWGTSCYNFPGWCDTSAYDNAQGVLDAGFPVIVTEFGDQNSSGTVGAPFASSLLPKLDAMNGSVGISYLGWTFTVAGEPDNVLIKDSNGTPTDGYGVYVKAHYACRAAGTANCP